MIHTPKRSYLCRNTCVSFTMDLTLLQIPVNNYEKYDVGICICADKNENTPKNTLEVLFYVQTIKERPNYYVKKKMCIKVWL